MINCIPRYTSAQKKALSGQAINDNPIEELVNFNLLRKDLRAILTSYEIGDDIDDETWFLLAKTLHKILKDQPLVKPAAGIKSLQLIEATRGSVMYTVELSDKVQRICSDSILYEESTHGYLFFWKNED